MPPRALAGAKHVPEHEPERMPKPMLRVPMLLIVMAGDVYEAWSITENVRDEFEPVR
ncbi:MAG: hypothetical protein ACAH81_12845 [Actinomycetota bacterium]